MKPRKFTREEKKEIQLERRTQSLAGSGRYIFKNRLAAEIILARPTHTGQRKVPGNGTFEGDSYYLPMVTKTRELSLVETLETPEQQKEALMAEQKLILDQPDIVTVSGKVEHIVKDQNRLLHEASNQPQPEVLLNEGPGADGFIIVKD